ncbi:MAG: hypothetical protein NWQ46_07485 [Spirosomaceae bacterium]|nr:hypothetical protein [Spirosomataceae bacterium]
MSSSLKIILFGFAFSVLLGYYCSNSMGGGDIIYLLFSFIFHVALTFWVYSRKYKKGIIAVIVSAFLSYLIFWSINYWKRKTEPSTRFESAIHLNNTFPDNVLTAIDK